MKKIISAILAFSLSISGLAFFSDTGYLNNENVSYVSAASTTRIVDPHANVNYQTDSNVTSILVFADQLTVKGYMDKVVSAIKASPNISEIKYRASQSTPAKDYKTVSLVSYANCNFHNNVVDKIISCLNYEDNKKIGDYIMRGISVRSASITSRCHNDYEKIKAIYDYIYDHSIYSCDVTYYDMFGKDWAPFYNYESSDYRETTIACYGFAKEFAILANEAGITTYIGLAYGDGDNNTEWGHAYNIVRLYGHYYYIDLSNDTYFKTHGSPSEKYANFLVDLETFRAKDSNHIFGYDHTVGHVNNEQYKFDYVKRNGNKESVLLVINTPESVKKYNYVYRNTIKIIAENSQTVYGDINGDGVCDRKDYNILYTTVYAGSRAAAYKEIRNFEYLDFDHNNAVNSSDYEKLLDFVKNVRKTY